MDRFDNESHRQCACFLLLHTAIISLYIHSYFDYHQTMDAEDADLAVARIAAAIGEPARVRMLYCLHDNHARTATELAVIAEVSPSTASTHLNKLKEEQLIEMQVQGKHRYYRLKDSNVARALESLSVIAGHKYKQFVPNTPVALREARTCYDHIAGRVGVLLHNCLVKLHWISQGSEDNYDLTSHGEKALTTHGIDVEDARLLRRRFAYACID